MHYKNGRFAKNGDKIVSLTYGIAGILYNTVPGTDTCNGRICRTKSNDEYVNIKDCLHIDDLDKATVPDTSKKE